jgi:hypothetical protein
VAAGIVTIAVVNPRRSAQQLPATVAMSKPPQPVPEPAPQGQAAPEGAPKPKRALEEAPVGSRRAKAAKKDELERDAFVPRNAPAAPPSPEKMARAATPPPVTSTALPLPPPAVAMAPPVQPQSASSEQVQSAQSKLADAVRPPVAAVYPMEARKEAPGRGARDLYYAMQASVANGFVNQPRAAKAGQRTFAAGASGVITPALAGGVRYSILRRNADGSFAEVDPATIFVTGDSLRLRFETNQQGNLGVMERQPNGTWTLRLAARMQPGEPVQMPSESTIDIRTPGAVRFFVRFSPSLRSEPRLDRVTPTANLLRENAANSVYVVNPAWTADAAVDFELAINAK